MDIIMREYGRLIWQTRWPFFLILAAMASTVVLDLSIPLIYKNIANGLSKPFSDITYYVLMENLLWLAFIYLAIWLSWRLLEFGMIPFQAGGMRYLDQLCFNTLLKQPYSFFEDNFAGSLVKQANRFIRAYETIMDWLVFQLFGNVLAIIIAFILFWQQQPEFALYFLAWALVFIIWSVSYSIWKLKFDERVAEWDSTLGGAYSDAMSNISIIKSFALEPREQQNITEIAQNTYKSRRLAWILMFISFAVQGALTFIIEILLIYLMIEKWQYGNFLIGEYVLFQAILIMLIHRLWDFGRYFRNFFTALADAREMAEVFRRTEVEQDTPHAQAYPIKHGKIQFKQIHFEYGHTNAKRQNQDGRTDRYTTTNHGLFDDFNLTIKAGEKIALVGHSGSGKTSLIKLLFRFVEQQQGNIVLDGIDSKDFCLQALRTQIALVPQQPELFHRSIRDNITLGQPLSQTTLEATAAKAGALEFIQKLPDGFDTLVGERGVKLSGGEKQRIAIARAFIQQAPIVVLDEATSALDSLTEQQIQVAIFDLISDKTAIVIAHRLSTILRMDRIIVLHQGRIIEQGNHHELLALEGYYYRMWQHQSGEFLHTSTQ